MENENEEGVGDELETTDEDNSANELEALRKKVKTLEAQKEHFRAKSLKPKEDLIKTNTPSGLTRDEAILFAKGYTEEEVILAAKLAVIEGTTPLKAIDSDYFKNKVESRLAQERSDKAQIVSTGTSPIYKQESVQTMTEEEHKAAYFKEVERLLGE